MSFRDNPFQILGVAPGAGKAEVIAATGRAMRERQAALQQIATAQKALLDPIRRGAHVFVHTLDVPRKLGLGLGAAPGPRSDRREESRAGAPEPLVRLTVFDPPS